MSVRIETVEQLQNPKLVEQVLDRLRRTTKPRYFAFKKRCKILGDKPVLITAPPGRKLKSSLLRELRLGSPTLKGVVHREKQRLIFTFSRSVNKNDTAKWIAKCMHDAKSPVPLKCVIIRTPKDEISPTDLPSVQMEPSQDEQVPLEDTENLLIDNDIPLPIASDEDNDEEILSPTTIHESPSLEALIAKHTSSKKMDWIREAEQQIDSLEQQLSIESSKLDTLEEQISDVQDQIHRLETQIENSPAPDSTQINPWQKLLQAIQASNMTLDGFRDILDDSDLPTNSLLKQIQFLSDDEEMVAYTEIRHHCQDKATEWETQQSPTLQFEQHVASLQSALLDLEAQYADGTETLSKLEEEQQRLLLKLATRKLSIFDKVVVFIQEPELMVELNQRHALCTAILSEE